MNKIVVPHSNAVKQFIMTYEDTFKKKIPDILITDIVDIYLLHGRRMFLDSGYIIDKEKIVHQFIGDHVNLITDDFITILLDMLDNDLIHYIDFMVKYDLYTYDLLVEKIVLNGVLTVYNVK